MSGSPGPSLGELVDHIVAHHHTYLRRELRDIRALLERSAREEPQHHGPVQALVVVFEPFRSAVEAHMQKEEQIVFPRLRELETALRRPGCYSGGLTVVIREMEQAHRVMAAALDQFRRLTHGYGAAPGAGPHFRRLLERLEALETRMQQHRRLEEEQLIPRAQAAKASLRESTR